MLRECVTHLQREAKLSCWPGKRNNSLKASIQCEKNVRHTTPLHRSKHKPITKSLSRAFLEGQAEKY